MVSTNENDIKNHMFLMERSHMSLYGIAYQEMKWDERKTDSRKTVEIV